MKQVSPIVVADTNTLSDVNFYGIVIAGDGTNTGTVTIKKDTSGGATLFTFKVASTGVQTIIWTGLKISGTFYFAFTTVGTVTALIGK